MKRMARVDKGLRSVNKSPKFNGIGGVVSAYHQQRPCCVVKKDRSCDQKHDGSNKWTELSRNSRSAFSTWF